MKLFVVPPKLEVSLYGEERAGKRALVRSIQAGDKVTALFPAGQKLEGDKIVQEWAERTGKVNPLLIFPEHVVINLGGRHGTPGVVDERNIVSVSRPRGAP